jgi:hypothetical protein
MVLLHAGTFRLITPVEKVATYEWNSHTVQHHICVNCGCGTYSESPDWSSGKPDFDNPRVGGNSRLLDDFDLDPVPVKVIDGKNLSRIYGEAAAVSPEPEPPLYTRA